VYGLHHAQGDEERGFFLFGLKIKVNGCSRFDLKIGGFGFPGLDLKTGSFGLVIWAEKTF
jgi:hypothetical protein